jgi:hypothetical protein
VLIFKACEHVGHKNVSMTLSTPPSAARVPGSYDDPLSQVKLPKMSQGGPRYATAWRRRDPAGQYPGYPPLIERYGIDAKLFKWSDEITTDCWRKQAMNLNRYLWRAMSGSAEGGVTVGARQIARPPVVATVA